MNHWSTEELLALTFVISVFSLIVALAGWFRQTFWLGYMHKKFENLWDYVTTGTIKK